MRDPLFILAVLCLNVVASEWLCRHTALRHLGSALLVIVLTAIVANLRIIPAGSTAAAPVPLYDAIFAYVAPISIFWLLLQVNLRSVLKAGAPMILMYLLGAAAVMLGVWIAVPLVSAHDVIGPLAGAVGGMYTGTYIGGSINFNAVALSYGVEKNGLLFGGAIVVDNVITTVWMIATLAVPRFLAGRWKPRWTVARPATGAEPLLGIEDDTETVHPMDFALVLAMGVLAQVLSVWLASAIQRWFRVDIPAILIITIFALVLAQIPAVARLRGARMLGMFAVYIFLAVIGAFCDIPAMLHLGRLGVALLGLAGITVLVHGIVSFGAAWLLRVDPDVAAVASQANVGGSTSALALARSLGREDLILPGILMGALGNAIGTFLGFAMAQALR
ncbi:MAG TPA: DUF819 family protein [Gemmatimonadaceae bacterium]|nr:DUF819 family protein [Gemmatimonadaceae bacterium]